MTTQYKFRATIESAGGGGAYIPVPWDVEQAFGKKRVKVKATIEGIEYRGSLVRMGGAGLILGILKDIREKTGKHPGDEIEVVLEIDTEPRLVEIPEDVQEALGAEPGLEEIFSQLSFTHQKEFVRWVEAAKRPETRRKRIVQLVQQLVEKKRQ